MSSPFNKSLFRLKWAWGKPIRKNVYPLVLMILLEIKRYLGLFFCFTPCKRGSWRDIRGLV